MSGFVKCVTDKKGEEDLLTLTSKVDKKGQEDLLKKFLWLTNPDLTFNKGPRQILTWQRAKTKGQDKSWRDILHFQWPFESVRITSLLYDKSITNQRWNIAFDTPERSVRCHVRICIPFASVRCQMLNLRFVIDSTSLLTLSVAFHLFFMTNLWCGCCP